MRAANNREGGDKEARTMSYKSKRQRSIGESVPIIFDASPNV